MNSMTKGRLFALAAEISIAVACHGLAAGPAPRGVGGQIHGLLGLSLHDVEKFDFSRQNIDGTMEFRLRHTARDLLKLLRQRAKFVLANSPDARAEWNARIVVGITDQMGLGDGPQPPPPPPPAPPGPPGPPPPPPSPPPPNPPAPPPATSALVVPGDPDHSPMVLRVEGVLQPGMPLARPLPSDQARVFRQWVKAGATEQQYKKSVQPVVAANCVFCHSRATPSARLSLQSWEDVKARIGPRLAAASLD
ncbi:MAG: hypothetical protein HY303_15605 [Candidatus Wallbacteria bacterium]|nr:hypothetical protein [Candidatus Wallbacteria bacterium]